MPAATNDAIQPVADASPPPPAPPAPVAEAPAKRAIPPVLPPDAAPARVAAAPSPVAAAASTPQVQRAAPNSPPPAAESGRATLEVFLQPRRAGTNLLSVAVDYEAVVRNTGEATARDVQLGLALMSAHANIDAEVIARLNEPLDTQLLAPFTLEPGMEQVVSGMAMLPRDKLPKFTIAGRPLFVPIVVLDVRYGWATGSGRTAQAWMVGIVRGDAEKLAPFRLDGAPRMHQDVAVRSFVDGVEE